MNASELVVEVRDLSLARVAQLTAADLADLIVVSRQNEVGSWQLTLPDTVLDPTTGAQVKHAGAQQLRKEGAGIIVTAPGQSSEVLISGPMTSATYVADENDLTGKWSFTGVSDMVLLADALAYPDPQTSPDPGGQLAANDTRTATAEDLLRQYVAYNIANGAIAVPAASWALPGRLTGLRNKFRLRGTSQGRGPTLTKSPRFQNLLELCQEIGFAGGLNFDIVQVGAVLEFVISQPTDRTKTIRMDMDNQLLKSVTYGFGAPSTTIAVVAGQGVGTDRQLLARTSTAASDSETRWGRRIERFVDQRQTDDPAELAQKGDEEVLAGAASASGLQAAPTDSDAMLYLRDWRTGDRISVVVEGQEVAAQVTEAALSIDGAAVIFVATLGDPAAFDHEAAAQSRSSETNSRVSALERNDVPIPDLDASKITSGTLDPARIPALDAAKVATGTFDPARIPNLDASKVTGGTFNAARIPALDGSKITTGRVGTVGKHVGENATLNRIYIGTADNGTGTALDMASTYIGIDGINGGSNDVLWIATQDGGQNPFTVSKDGHIRSNLSGAIPWAQSAGTVTFTNQAAGTTGSIAVTFPAGRFTQPPIVQATVRTSDPKARGVAVSDPTTTGFTLYFYNGATGTITNSVGWTAIQMASGNASG